MGICPEANVKVSSYNIGGSNNVPAAINEAANALSAGDIILVEYAARSAPPDPLHKDVPAEYDPQTKSAIENAVNIKGIIVIEAAGNSSININSFLHDPTSSGAIIVAAGQWDKREAETHSNWGNRVDIHASGEYLVTAGYGSRWDGGNHEDPTNNYVAGFGQTSGASAVVAGVIGSIQGIYYAATGQKLTPAQMRDVLVESGIPHQNGNQNIGRRVSLPGAVNYLIDHYGLNLDRFLTVSADQRDAAGLSFGSLGHYKLDQFIQHPVPHNFSFQDNSGQVTRALQDYKPNTTQKYNDWEGIEGVTNHHLFTIEAPTPQPIISVFQTAHNATIQTEFITLNQDNAGYVEFKDPWLRIDGDTNYYDPPYGYRNLGMAGAALEPYDQLPLQLLTTNIFKGVFLDQSGPPFWEPPYYSVAPPPDPIDGVTYFLDHWSASPPGSAEFEDEAADTTAVVFRDPNAVVTATMKGRMASNIPTATAYNNSRKIGWERDGTYHMAYEDGGHIWYARSTNHG